jgi:uncharacterized protein YggE
MDGMRRSLFLAAAAAVAAFAVAMLGGVGRSDAALGDAPAHNTVTTTGHGVVTVVPDQAQVTAGVHTQATTAAGALAENAQLMTKVIAALKAAGGRDLQTQQVSLYPRTNESGDVVGYTADDTVSASSKIEAAGDLVDAAVGAGANNVSGPTLSVSDRDALYRQALAKALDDARAKAAALANAGGFAVGAVSSVTEQAGGVPGPVFESAAGAKAASTPVEPGTQDISADVSVAFAIN